MARGGSRYGCCGLGGFHDGVDASGVRHLSYGDGLGLEAGVHSQPGERQGRLRQ
jgi:hypothetical protein